MHCDSYDFFMMTMCRECLIAIYFFYNCVYLFEYYKMKRSQISTPYQVETQSKTIVLMMVLKDTHNNKQHICDAKIRFLLQEYNTFCCKKNSEMADCCDVILQQTMQSI